MKDTKTCKLCGTIIKREDHSHAEYASRKYCGPACYARARRNREKIQQHRTRIVIPGLPPGVMPCDHCTRLRTLSEVRTKAKTTEQWCQTCQQVAAKDLAETVEVV